jgi:regulatory protein
VNEDETYSLRTLENKIKELQQNLLPQVARDHLTRYTKTSTEVLRHFQRKGYPKPLIERIVERLRREGFIDDEEAARRHVRRRVEKKYYGRFKLLAELQERGIPRQLTEELLQEHFPPSKEKKKAREYAQKNENVDSSTLASRLENRGFPSSVISEVIDRVNEF